MKKFLICLGLLFGFMYSANAEVILAPQWSEFCPVSYLSAKASKLSTNANYWYERRIQFENSINECKQYKDEDLSSCYAQVRKAEINKNKSWNNKIEAEEQRHQEYVDYNNKQQTINAINSIIKTIKW